jgi:hypothetical protein
VENEKKNVDWKKKKKELKRLRIFKTPQARPSDGMIELN